MRSLFSDILVKLVYLATIKHLVQYVYEYFTFILLEYLPFNNKKYMCREKVFAPSVFIFFKFFLHVCHT